MRTCRTRTSGAQRRLWWRKGVSTFQQKFELPDTSTDHCCTVCGAYLFSTTPCVHKLPTFSCPLASNTLTWAAFSRPLSCFGLSTRDDVSCLCSRGAMAPCYFTFKLLCAAMASDTPWSARTHHPTFAPVSPRLLLCGSLSHSLPLTLSCPLSCPLSRSPSLRSFSIAPLALSLSSPFLSHCVPHTHTHTHTHTHSLSLSLSLSHKRGFRDVRCISIPPGVRTILYRTEEVRLIHWAMTIGYLHHLLQSVLLPPACHPLSCISPFAWGCAQQRVEESHSVPGYRVRLPKERSLEQPQEVRSARHPHMHAVSSSAH